MEEWEEAPGRALYRSKVIPQERVETTLTPSTFPPLSLLPHCLPCCSPVHRVPGAAAGRLWVLSELISSRWKSVPPPGLLLAHLPLRAELPGMRAAPVLLWGAVRPDACTEELLSVSLLWALLEASVAGFA